MFFIRKTEYIILVYIYLCSVKSIVYRMKKTFIFISLSLFMSLTSTASTIEESNTNAQRTFHYSNRNKIRSFMDSYYGFRIGASIANISSENKFLGSDSQTGLNVAFTYGIGMTTSAPLYFETGIAYVEKGGQNTYSGGKYEYNLDYLELPFTLKYIYNTSIDLSFQPFFGGYFAAGIAGKVKDYATRTAYNSFSDNANAFRTFDGGIRFGCGLGYDLMYAELAYELGLSNITHDTFNTAHNRSLILSVGVNF